MVQSSSGKPPNTRLSSDEPIGAPSESMRRRDAHDSGLEYTSLTVIPWSDIWRSLEIAKHHGNRPMVSAFYEMLFREGLFDDRGAWSLKLPKAK